MNPTLRAPLLGLLLALPPCLSAAAAPQEPLDPQPVDRSQRNELGGLGNRRTPEVLAAQAARPAVVYIETDQVVAVGYNLFGQRVLRENKSSGSGAVIFDDGFVVTNFHVIRGANKITVYFDKELDPTPYAARLVSAVESEDLALLKIERAEPFPTIPLGTSSDLMIAEPVLAIGNPFGQTLTVSRGIISGLHRYLEVGNLQFQGLIQTDASINPGNSGGPLININGELIGINTAMNAQAENIGFAIPVDRLRQVLEQSLLSPSQAQAWFGLELGQEKRALEVVRLMADSPAERAGVQLGDRIVALAGRTLQGLDDYNRQRLAIAPGETVALMVERAGAQVALELSTWHRLEGYLFERAGLRVSTIPVSDGRNVFKLLRLTDVRRGSPASKLGLEPGDFIDTLLVNGRRPFVSRTPQDLAIYLSQLPQRTSIELDVWRDSNQNGQLEGDSQRSELMRGTLELE
jgi:serine protease Do